MVAPGAAGGENVSNDIGVTADGENNESDASTAKVTPPQRGSMQVVIQFEIDETASTVDVVATDKFGPATFEPPGVRYEKVEQTNAYRRTYNRTYVEGPMLWRLKTVKVGTMQNGEVGGAGNLAFYHAPFECDYCQSPPETRTLETAVVRFPDEHVSRTV